MSRSHSHQYAFDRLVSIAKDTLSIRMRLQEMADTGGDPALETLAKEIEVIHFSLLAFGHQLPTDPADVSDSAPQFPS